MSTSPRWLTSRRTADARAGRSSTPTRRGRYRSSATGPTRPPSSTCRRFSGSGSTAGRWTVRSRRPRGPRPRGTGTTRLGAPSSPGVPCGRSRTTTTSSRTSGGSSASTATSTDPAFAGHFDTKGNAQVTGWVRTPLVGGPVQVLGAAELEPTSDGVRVHRLPALAREQLPDDFVRMCEEQPSGVRLVFRTVAQRIELDVRALRTAIVGRPLPPGGLYDVVIDGERVTQAAAPEYGVLELDPIARRATAQPAPVTTVTFPSVAAGDKDVEIWLPFAEVTRLVALRTDAPVTSSRPGAMRPRWVHHGSSISHGAGADSPTGTWPVVAARRAGVGPRQPGSLWQRRPRPVHRTSDPGPAREPDHAQARHQRRQSRLLPAARLRPGRTRLP